MEEKNKNTPLSKNQREILKNWKSNEDREMSRSFKKIILSYDTLVEKGILSFVKATHNSKVYRKN